MPLLDPEFLQKLEYLSLVSRRVFRGQLLAQKRTMQRGGGIEFADHRDYTAGDDFRYLDWNVYARHGELLLKRFQEEEDLHVYIFVDCSRSMSGGEPAKVELAKQLAAAMAYIGLADLDRVSILSFSQRLLDVYPLTRGKEQILNVIRFLENCECDGAATSVAQMATEFVHRNHRPGLAVVISDFFDPEGYERGVDLLRHRHFEPHLIHIHTATDAEPTVLGDVELLDVESGSLRQVTVTERSLRQYRDAFDQFAASMRAYCRNYSLGCTRTTNEVPFDELMLTMMRASGVVR